MLRIRRAIHPGEARIGLHDTPGVRDREALGGIPIAREAARTAGDEDDRELPGRGRPVLEDVGLGDGDAVVAHDRPKNGTRAGRAAAHLGVGQAYGRQKQERG